MAYPKTSISIQIWCFGSKCQRISALIKTFYRWIKIFLVLGIKKSVSNKLTFAKLDFSKLNLLDLAENDFLDLTRFAMVDKFWILLPISPPLVSSSVFDILRFFSLLLTWMFRDTLPVNLSVVYNIKVNSATILLKFLINLL